MARNKIGDVLSRMAAFVGIVDEDEEPKKSRKYADEDDREDSYDRQNSYSPRVRRNDRSQQGSTSRVRTAPYNRAEEEPARRPASRRSADNRRKDSYNEWNSAPRSQNRYADSIYDDDTTSRGDTNRNYDFGEDFTSAQKTNSRNPKYEAQEEPRAKNSRHASSGEVVVLELHSLADCKSVILSLLESKTVFISVENMPREMIRRVEDTLSGAVYALDATFRQTSEVSYLLAPNSIAVSGTRRTTERNY